MAPTLQGGRCCNGSRRLSRTHSACDEGADARASGDSWGYERDQAIECEG